MLRNLLYNPQIQVLLICGHDRSGSKEELEKYFELGLESVTSSLVQYRPPESGVKVSPAQIRQTKRIIDDLVKPEHFSPSPQLVWLGDPQEKELVLRIKKFLSSYQQQLEGELKRSHTPLPEVEVPFFPSNPRGHIVVRDDPLEAWKELLYLLTRFGRRVTLKKGDRLELQNVKVVVEKPKFESEDKLKACNLDTKKLKRYQDEILRVEPRAEETSFNGQIPLPFKEEVTLVKLRPDETYSYGHRLRQYFGFDALAECAKRIKKDPEDRKSYFALWDSHDDLTGTGSRPCFVSLFFRKFEEKLTLTATFRTHNALDGWLLNFYGLMSIQGWVAGSVGMLPGPITVISHSLGLDPRQLDRALMVIGQRPFKVRLDPMGYFRITLDGKEILVEHRFEDVTLREYRGRKAERLQHEIARDVALSDINHAIYLGRQLAKAEMALKEGREFVQD